MKTLLALPAYGRDYATPDACADDWDAGKDFKVYNGPYFSIRDEAKIVEDGYGQIALFNMAGKRLVTIDLEP